MINTLFSIFRISKLYSMLGFKPTIIQVLDNIANANSKQQMTMAIFHLHSKFYENVDFDNLFFNVLDRLLIIDNYEEYVSYLDISAQIIVDSEITEDMLRQILLDWIYGEPFFKRQIINEIPEATVEELTTPVVDVSFV